MARIPAGTSKADPDRQEAGFHGYWGIESSYGQAARGRGTGRGRVTDQCGTTR